MRYGIAVYLKPKFQAYRVAPPRCTTHYEREKAMKIISIYIKEDWTADEIRENIAALFDDSEMGGEYADTIVGLLLQTDRTECVVECEGAERPEIVKRSDIYESGGMAEISEQDFYK